MWKLTRTDSVSEKDALFHDLINEVNLSSPGARLSFTLRNKLERFPLETRREIVNRVKQGCSPLFTACKKGQQEIVEYLIHTCGADIEQKGTYEVPEDRSIHIVSPLWCAAVSGKLPIVLLLIAAGADINAVSDSGSTPIRSACFMTHFEVVRHLVINKADINKPNYNGGTCLINSVQSELLCRFLLVFGADVNAKDIQNKTALHYAIQEHRLETTKLLLEYGADYNAKSRYGDDALQMACLKGATRIFEYLTQNINYSPERIANAHELMGATFLDEHNDMSICLQHWRQAVKIRDENGLHPKKPSMPLQKGYRNQKEFETEEELLALSGDLDSIRIQSLLIAERILGTHHKDTIFRLMYRGAAYADIMRFQRCVDLWRRALQIRIEKDTILYTDTCFTAQALVKLLIDYHVRSVRNRQDNTAQRFHDVAETFKLLSRNIVEVKPLLLIRPQYKQQLEFFEKIFRYLIHLMYVMIECARTKPNQDIATGLLLGLLRSNVKSFLTGDSILHLCASQLTTMRPTNYSEEQSLILFPRETVIKVLLQCRANANVKNGKGQTPLHMASVAYNFSHKLVKLLLDFGAHLDQPDAQGHTPLEAIKDLMKNNYNMANLSLINYTNLKCMCATSVVKYNITYKGQIPKTLENFVRMHEP